MKTKSIKESPRWQRNWTVGDVVIGTRVVLLRTGALGERLAGSITDIRISPHLKRFVVLRDDGETAYASEVDVAIEADPKQQPLGLSVHEGE
jgi:hypothetical protein